MSKHHTLPASPETVHWGYFDARLKPVLTIDSGDRVTIDSVSGAVDDIPTDSRFEVLPEHRAIHAKHTPRLGAHILTGPIAVNGAEAGDVLEIRILEVSLRQNWAYSKIVPLKGSLPEDFPLSRRLHIPLDRTRNVGKMPWGTDVPLAPFFGVMGVAPPAVYGAVSSVEPREYGGNIDLKELQAGATFFLPVFSPGALFSAGDGHAVQGDGEVCLTALETSMRGTFEFILHKKKHWSMPRALTATHFITVGLDVDLDDAAKQALREMIKLLGEVGGLSREDAYQFCSIACDLRVTQLVDGNKGIHAMVRRDLVPNVKPII
jgi:acetamidase/formamidase